MSSRRAILQAIRAAQEARELPGAPDLHSQTAPSIEAFCEVAHQIGYHCVRGRSLVEAKAWLQANVPVGGQVASNVAGLPGNLDWSTISDPHQLAGLHTAVLAAKFGVCENGALWLDESDLGPHRVLPFIAEHLLLLVKASDLVADMHQAYRRLGSIGGGFGLFLAGPSKTADIEQCLVIGAHGARTATLFLLES